MSERAFYTCVWNGLAVGVSLAYLTGAFWQSLLIAIFFFISSVLHFGRRWLLQVGFVISIVAIAVSLGFPHPAEWWQIAADTLAVINTKVTEFVKR